MGKLLRRTLRSHTRGVPGEIVEHVIPAHEMQNGYSGGLHLALLTARQGALGEPWEIEQDILTTDEASHWFRLFGAEAAEGTVTDVETYEVYIARLDHAQP